MSSILDQFSKLPWLTGFFLRSHFLLPASAISVRLTTGNSNDLEIRVPGGSRWVNVIESYSSEFLACNFILVINCTEVVSCMLYEI